MIYINRLPDQTSTTIFLSKPIYKQEGELSYKITLVHTSTNRSYEFEGYLSVVGDYYKIDFPYAELVSDGEYDYRLEVANETSTGLIRIGDYNNQNIQFDLDLKYIQPEI